MILREISKLLEQKIKDSKIIILVGPRQVGKTTLLKTMFKTEATLWLNGDDADVRSKLSNTSSTYLKQLVGTHDRLIIDEAQRIENIGLTLKILHDQLPEVKVLATGSSAFELANQINEPLTGRKWEFHLWPISFEEMANHHSLLEEERLLEHRLVYGWYPEVINNPGSEKLILNALSDSYLYKDILTWEDIKKPQKLEALVQALAFQIGQQVSYHELGQIVGLNNETVERYINLLEKAFIIFRLPSLSRNLRNELKKSRKIYFYDVGIRNSVIKNWNPVAMRQDVGALWENFLIVERLKHKSYNQLFSNDYFWRTHAQQEIDFIEESGGVLHAYEFKWNPKRKAKFSKAFKDGYPNHELSVVNKTNFLDFVQKPI
ncbi:ATP-binding protein [Subsaximicrobium wynnwilliamsii]|uniref:ATP-binding protein n=1 Tax=Subsaximicrobium wynnwilliamsii TaxID=291179 RepID=A0A5C6ZD34_9FLAO|nr:ATP-binding protein [Subsaximicrobium wynnwilliamsii]TXD81458.1 ATP-binding protein [Subsaximicrobium wynnwilliamsii]TXD87064.1 ATP-binding protein [Subsaximicrobium wynnwilliamsii]TXE00813.1 ATP-binding protein [Subsaximicrobium wynnwilliamsii]